MIRTESQRFGKKRNAARRFFLRSSRIHLDAKKNFSKFWKPILLTWANRKKADSNQSTIYNKYPSYTFFNNSSLSVHSPKTVVGSRRNDFTQFLNVRNFLTRLVSKCEIIRFGDSRLFRISRMDFHSGAGQSEFTTKLETPSNSIGPLSQKCILQKVHEYNAGHCKIRYRILEKIGKHSVSKIRSTEFLDSKNSESVHRVGTCFLKGFEQQRNFLLRPLNTYQNFWRRYPGSVYISEEDRRIDVWVRHSVNANSMNDQKTRLVGTAWERNQVTRILSQRISRLSKTFQRDFKTSEVETKNKIFAFKSIENFFFNRKRRLEVPRIRTTAGDKVDQNSEGSYGSNRKMYVWNPVIQQSSSLFLKSHPVETIEYDKLSGLDRKSLDFESPGSMTYLRKRTKHIEEEEEAVTENRSQSSTKVYQQRNPSLVRSTSKAEHQSATALEPTVMNRLVDDVLRKVEKNLRIDKERRGY